ncbi:hypothetical protein SD70_10825 [Gordoniibacillus kamchatkensis]|uniref:Glucosamine/galactosamine-6-phosphate isomerase domain-containing protein n=1 Tax=Gordoniibacillus kamchatkensis TaxID=1590651 RepID=A0ABR5AIN6_9BACL|nr:glucosamine-6-phosphate deaminase [Paenibacillus sp. VKM B-2647]KIL40907.1 hypothetical protein SD70_10825 [Paenibacillus sp. VKM B-2647]
MNLIVTANYEQMSARAAELIIDVVKRKPDALLALAAGETPLGTFAHLVGAAREGRVRFDRCKFVSLDEWVGLDGRTHGSCRQTLHDHFFSPLAIAEEQICFFDGTAPDLKLECERMDSFIAANGPIDGFLLGVGMNGHLGFNEPGVSFDLYTHVTLLDQTTKSVSVKYFQEQQDVNKGITLGIKHIMEAKTVILIANGAKKADIVKAAATGAVTEQVPASVLQRHPNACIIVDEQAAAKLNYASEEGSER